MNIKKACPWCDNNLSTSRPGAYRTETKWRGISLYPKFVLVCPHCSEKIKVGE